jgi:hypothetical protein
MRVSVLAVAVLAACGSDGDEAGDGEVMDAECDACPFNPLVDAVESMSEQMPMDCGHIGAEFEAEAWTVAHDCALAALQNQTAVVVVWQSPAIDNAHFTAIVGGTGESYAITMIEWDCQTGLSASRRSCNSVASTRDCTVEPGSMCLDCVGAQQEMPLCE